MWKALRVDKSKCTGCRICEVICGLAHTGSIWPAKSGIRIEETGIRDYTASVCKQCQKPPCLGACEVNALALNDGVVYVEEDACNGCGSCVAACPFNAIFLDEKVGRAIKCDLCSGSPSCVGRCPTQAIEILSRA